MCHSCTWMCSTKCAVLSALLRFSARIKRRRPKYVLHKFTSDTCKIVGRRRKPNMSCYFEGQSPACFRRCIFASWTLHLFGNQRIVSRITHYGDPSMIFGRCSQKSYATWEKKRNITSLIIIIIFLNAHANYHRIFNISAEQIYFNASFWAALFYAAINQIYLNILKLHAHKSHLHNPPISICSTASSTVTLGLETVFTNG